MVDQHDPVQGIAALADALRRRLYDHVCSQPQPVSRDQVAAALGIPHHKVKFHLDRLTADGLLEASYARTSGRTGPGAGRPSKLYRRPDREVSVSLPERQYALAGELLAAAIDETRSTGQDASARLGELAAERGRTLASELAATPGDSLDRVGELLARHGYEPRREGDRATLRNCPFHALARRHTDLVCTMNLRLIEGAVESLDDVDARLEPAPDRCCVVLERTANPGAGLSPPKTVTA